MKRLLPLLLLCLLLVGCGASEKQNKETATVFAMDTVMTLTAYAPEDYPGYTTGAALAAAEDEIRRLEDMLSVTDENSQIYAFDHGDRAALSQEAQELATTALYYAALTEGCYDPTVYPLMELWGFYGDTPGVPASEALEKALTFTGYVNCSAEEELAVPEGFGLDLGGIAKGYTADRVLEEMRSSGLDTAIISLGGNVAFMGQKPDGSAWNIGIENPDKTGEYLGNLRFAGMEFKHVVTSGGYERNFQENGVTYHHILDPETGYPAESDLLSVTIVAGMGAMADAFSTALFVMGLEEAVEFWRESTWDFDMVLYDGETLYITPGITIETELPVREVTR